MRGPKGKGGASYPPKTMEDGKKRGESIFTRKRKIWEFTYKGRKKKKVVQISYGEFRRKKNGGRRQSYLLTKDGKREGDPQRARKKEGERKESSFLFDGVGKQKKKHVNSLLSDVAKRRERGGGIFSLDGNEGEQESCLFLQPEGGGRTPTANERTLLFFKGGREGCSFTALKRGRKEWYP